MKKLDKLILNSFVGPFVITFMVVVFILLTQHMLKYFDDIIGKGLGWDTIGQLLFYFAIFMTPVAMPLAVLLSSLIAFGNLGEHFELTAIKGAGISLIRTLRPIFIFVVGLTGVAFYVNNMLVPKAALEAYSLLWDIKQKKPALDLREGEFYSGIPDINIKVDKRFDDGITLNGIIIYDHRRHDGNNDITIADSGRMYTILDERYLKLELFNGYKYTEGQSTEQGARKVRGDIQTLSRSSFESMQIVFDLSSFDLARTDKKWFQSNRIMRNMAELSNDIDSLDNRIFQQRLNFYYDQLGYFRYYSGRKYLPPDLKAYRTKADSMAKVAAAERPQKQTSSDSTGRSGLIAGAGNNRNSRTAPIVRKQIRQTAKRLIDERDLRPATLSATVDSIANGTPWWESFREAAASARRAKESIASNGTNVDNAGFDYLNYRIQWHKIITNSLACIAMFLIGAPLGAIIKKGGLGVPFLVSILFFIIFYLVSMFGEKWAKQGTVPLWEGVWAADFILLLIGLVFLRQARIDARLLESDFYRVWIDKLRTAATRKRLAPAT